VLDRADGRVRRTEEVVVVTRIIHQVIELRRGDLCVPRHERHLRVRLAHQHDVPAGAPRLTEKRQQVDDHVGVGAEAQLQLAIHHAPREQVRDDIDAAGERIARDMGVVGAQIVPLGLTRL